MPNLFTPNLDASFFELYALHLIFATSFSFWVSTWSFKKIHSTIRALFPSCSGQAQALSTVAPRSWVFHLPSSHSDILNSSSMTSRSFVHERESPDAETVSAPVLFLQVTREACHHRTGRNSIPDLLRPYVSSPFSSELARSCSFSRSLLIFRH